MVQLFTSLPQRATYLLTQHIPALLSSLIFNEYQICICKEALERVNSYEEWRLLAKQLDKLKGNHTWKKTPRSSLYNHEKIQSIMQRLKELRRKRDVHELIYTIRSELIKNKGNSANPLLYQRVHYGTKKLVMDYYEEVIKGLLYIATSKRLPLYKKIEFFTQARHSYGRTALMLSGGAANGLYHYGLIKTLHQHDLLPRIICGSSAGSLMASQVCTTPYDQLDQLIQDKNMQFQFVEFEVKSENPLKQLHFFLKKGYFLKIERLFQELRKKIGDITFQEAFDKYKWVLNITVCGENEQDDSMMMNYLTAPNVLICSAAAASCAVPNIFSPVVILCKNSRQEIVPYRQDGTRFVDGSVWKDLPLERMSQLFNINTFIVSQVNPYVIPFIADSDGGGVLGQGHRDNWITNVRSFMHDEIAHRYRQLEKFGVFPGFIKRIMNIFVQNYKGTVTVSPQPRYQDYLSLLRSPSPRFIRYAISHMAKCTYPKLALIRGVFGIEHELDRFYQNLKMELVRIRHPSDSMASIHLNPIFEEYQEDDEVHGPTQRQEEITEATRNMCLISLVKNPYLQIQNRHRKLLYKKEGSRHSGEDANSIESDHPHRGALHFKNQSRGESPASGMKDRKFSFADSESVISEAEEYELSGTTHLRGKGEGSRRIGSFLLPRTPTYSLIVKEEI